MLRRILQIAPLWFTFVIVYASFHTPGYSHLRQAISELAAPVAPLAWFVQYAGFIPFGIIFLLFGADLWRKQRNARMVALLFLLTGLWLVVAGFFQTEEFGRRNTPAGLIHAIAGILLIITVSLTPLTTAFILNLGRPLWLFSALTGLILVLLFVFLPNGISKPLIQFHQRALGSLFEFWYQNHGICQRLLFLVYFMWLEVFLFRPRAAGLPAG